MVYGDWSWALSLRRNTEATPSGTTAPLSTGFTGRFCKHVEDRMKGSPKGSSHSVCPLHTWPDLRRLLCSDAVPRPTWALVSPRLFPFPPCAGARPTKPSMVRVPRGVTHVAGWGRCLEHHAKEKIRCKLSFSPSAESCYEIAEPVPTDKAARLTHPSGRSFSCIRGSRSSSMLCLNRSSLRR